METWQRPLDRSGIPCSSGAVIKFCGGFAKRFLILWADEASNSFLITPFILSFNQANAERRKRRRFWVMKAMGI